MTSSTNPSVLHVGRPNIGDRARLFERIEGALDRNWLSNDGPLVQEFEQRVREIAGTRHAVATCNATNGLQIAMRACGLRPGDEVIVPTFTWIATAHALEWIGLVPVFCDVLPESGSADPEHVAELITPRTRAILPVHVFGYPAEVDELTAVAEDHGLPIVFDAAHAFGCTYGGTPIGGFGDAEVFSFHATKYINSFEGGALVTDDDDVAEQARLMRTMGLGPAREVEGPGTVARMSEISAAMGLTSLESMDEIVAANHANHRAYVEELEDVPGVRVRGARPGERANLQYLVVEIEPRDGIGRDEVHAELLAHGIRSRPYFAPCCHQQEPYRSAPARHAPSPLPRSEALSSRVLALPTGTSVGSDEVARVSAVIRATLTAADLPAAA